MNSSKEILEYFRILKKQDSLGTSYLFVGRDHGGVFDIVKLLSCRREGDFCNTCWDCRRIDERNHPDLFIVRPEHLMTTISAVRESVRFLSLKSFCLSKKVLIVEDGNSLNTQAANAFLKTLEEPPRNSFIAVCVSKLDGVLPTIVSRCRKIFLPSESEKVEDTALDGLAGFMGGQEVTFRDRKKFADFLWAFILLVRNSLFSRLACGNKHLPRLGECEILLAPKSIRELQEILKGALKVYSVHGNINMNLALNLIRLKL